MIESIKMLNLPQSYKLLIGKEDSQDTNLKTSVSYKVNYHLFLIEFVQKALNNFDQYKIRLEKTDWKVLLEDKKDGLIVWQRTSEEGLKAMKAQAIIDWSPQDVFRVIGDSAYRKDYDAVYDEGRILQKIADQTFIMYQKTKKIAVVSARDFVFMLHMNRVRIHCNHFIITKGCRWNHLLACLINRERRFSSRAKGSRQRLVISKF